MFDTIIAVAVTQTAIISLNSLMHATILFAIFRWFKITVSIALSSKQQIPT
jgi:hypothetical protein